MAKPNDIVGTIGGDEPDPRATIGQIPDKKAGLRVSSRYVSPTDEEYVERARKRSKSSVSSGANRAALLKKGREARAAEAMRRGATPASIRAAGRSAIRSPLAGLTLMGGLKGLGKIAWGASGPLFLGMTAVQILQDLGIMPDLGGDDGILFGDGGKARRTREALFADRIRNQAMDEVSELSRQEAIAGQLESMKPHNTGFDWSSISSVEDQTLMADLTGQKERELKRIAAPEGVPSFEELALRMGYSQ